MGTCHQGSSNFSFIGHWSGSWTSICQDAVMRISVLNKDPYPLCWLTTIWFIEVTIFQISLNVLHEKRLSSQQYGLKAWISSVQKNNQVLFLIEFSFLKKIHLKIIQKYSWAPNEMSPNPQKDIWSSLWCSLICHKVLFTKGLRGFLMTNSPFIIEGHSEWKYW